MNGIVYIQQESGDWLTENCFIAAKGFRALQFAVVPFRGQDIDILPLNKRDIVYGGINTTLRAFERLGVVKPALINAHQVLPAYIQREIKETTVDELCNNKAGRYPLFVKPLEDNKLFDGVVISMPLMTQLKLKYLDASIKLLVSDVLKIRSEYRCFVLEGQLIGAKNYKGDFDVLPDFELVRAAIQDYQNPPIAYSIDVAITTEGATEIIEINDGFALGAYALEAIPYATMMLRRWDEIMGNSVRDLTRRDYAQG